MGENIINRLRIKKEAAVISSIILLGAVLRIIFLAKEGLWYDEALTALSMQLPFFEMIRERLAAGHSPLYFMVLYPFTKLFGTGELVIRLPSAIASAVSVYFFYLISKRMLEDGAAARAATLFFSLSALNIYFASEARMYSFSVLFAVMSFYFLVKAIDENNIGDWNYYIFSTIVLLYLSASNALIIFPQVLYVLIKRSHLVEYFLTLLVSAFAYLPMAMYYVKMKKLGFIEWLPPVTPGTVREVFYGFGFRPVPVFATGMLKKAGIRALELLSVYFVGSFMVWGAVSSTYDSLKKGKLEKHAEHAILLVSWLVLPIVIAFLFSIFRQPILGPKRYLIMLSPAYYMLLGFALSRVKWGWLKNSLMAVLILLFSAALVIYAYAPTREDWRGAVRYVDMHYKQGEVMYGDVSTSTMYRYYGKHNDLVMIDVRYVYTRSLANGWVLLRKANFKKVFGTEEFVTKSLKAVEIDRYNGLLLYHIEK